MKQILWGDAKRGAALATAGVGAVGLVEYLITLITTPGDVGLMTALRFLALDVTLMGLALLALAPLLALGMIAARVAYMTIRPEAGRAWGGIGSRPPSDGVQPAAAWIWGFSGAAVLYIGASTGATWWFLRHYKAPIAIATILSVIQLLLVAVFALVGVVVASGARAAAQALEPGLGRWNPLGRVRWTLAILALLVVIVAAVARRFVPELRDALPWRMMLAWGVFAGAALALAPILARRGLWPARNRRIVIPAVIGGWVLLAALTLFKIGADEQVKALTTTPRTPLYNLVRFVRAANDFDGDGYGSLLGENDCAPFNGRIHPNARDIPDNGVDENCNGRDFSTKGLPSYKRGEKAPVPPEFARKDWNFLLITVDATRYDHTTMGGYKKAKGRDTTPRLEQLAERGVSFTFANAPSAGTMASMPAILCSRFFHSGIALGDAPKPHYPPSILPENTTIGEVMKRGGYTTGAITSHEYFAYKWLAQGFDTYDNSLGDTPDPNGTKSAEVTDKAIAWIAKQGDRKWTLWTHYIDPHGRYVAHPGDVEYGTSEEDLYDGEIHYTDKHIGRLLDYIAHSPAAGRTIIIVTSDHGDGFMEHGFINHGMALFRELLNVPLIVAVPDVEPHTVTGPVSPLDIMPTMADLAGIDISDVPIEGESLVPQIFYNRDAKERVVFSETNYPDPLRAAVSNDYKLIYNLKANLYQLYDLRKDPWEKTNVWGKDKKGSDKMKDLLDEWLDRVYFSRDPANQAQQKRAEVLLAAAPAPKETIDATIPAAIQVLGWDPPEPRAVVAGQEAKITVYFKTVAPPTQSYRLEAELDPTDGAPPPTPAPAPKPTQVPVKPATPTPVKPATPTPVKPAPRPIRQSVIPADGTFPTNRWKPGEYEKQTFTFRVPRDWAMPKVRVAFRFYDDARKPVVVVGANVDKDGQTIVLGHLDVTPAAPAPTPTPPAPLAPQPGAPKPGPAAPKPGPAAPAPPLVPLRQRQPAAPPAGP